MKSILLSLLLLACCTNLHAQHRVTVRVLVPPETPSGSTCFIAGNSPVLGDWNPGAIPMKQVSDSLWEFSADAPDGMLVEFKITRGSWNSQAIYTRGVIPDNVRFVVRSDTVVTLRPVSWQDLEAQSAGGIKGTVRYHRGLTGEGLRYPRDVIVWLPPSYERSPGRRYPVLYMHDGQNVFDPGTSFIGFDWRADEVSDSLIEAGAIDELIIVGIYNTPDRGIEYSDSLGREYAQFVIHRLKPLIDSTYRTLPDAQHTAVMGSSMGGLISFLFSWWYPDVFAKAGCLSSAFLVDDGSILKEVRAYQGPRKNIQVYLDCGTIDLDARLLPGSREMATLLHAKGYREGKDFELFVDQGATHNEHAWAARLWRPLTFLFGK